MDHWGGRAVNFRGGARGRDNPLARLTPSPNKGSIDGPLQIPTETDPQAQEMSRTQNSTKKKKLGFWNQRVEGVQKNDHLPCIC